MTSLTLFTICLALTAAPEPKTELLWPKSAPNALGAKPADQPSLTAYLPTPDKATGAAVVICPGGGYGHLAMKHEGKDPAEFLNSLGVAAFVLQYRIKPYRHPEPLHDAQRALRTVRARAKEWHVDPNRIGIWGFSAGGHLASTAATHFDAGRSDDADPIEKVSSRPDFAILAYPVITFTEPYLHRGSRSNLIGDPADEKLIELLSNEKQVTPQTPPTFLFHTNEDNGVVPENSIVFYQALRKNKVPAELHIYEKGKHGVGLAPNDPVLSTWKNQLAGWLQTRGLLTAAKE